MQSPAYYVNGDTLYIDDLVGFDRLMGIPESILCTEEMEDAHRYDVVCVDEPSSNGLIFRGGVVSKFEHHGVTFVVGMTVPCDDFFHETRQPLNPLTHVHTAVIECIPAYAQKVKALLTETGAKRVELSFSWID